MTNPLFIIGIWSCVVLIIIFIIMRTSIVYKQKPVHEFPTIKTRKSRKSSKKVWRKDDDLNVDKMIDLNLFLDSAQMEKIIKKSEQFDLYYLEHKIIRYDQNTDITKRAVKLWSAIQSEPSKNNLLAFIDKNKKIISIESNLKELICYDTKESILLESKNYIEELTAKFTHLNCQNMKDIVDYLLDIGLLFHIFTWSKPDKHIIKLIDLCRIFNDYNVFEKKQINNFQELKNLFTADRKILEYDLDAWVNFKYPPNTPLSTAMKLYIQRVDSILQTFGNQPVPPNNILPGDICIDSNQILQLISHREAKKFIWDDSIEYIPKRKEKSFLDISVSLLDKSFVDGIFTSMEKKMNKILQTPDDFKNVDKMSQALMEIITNHLAFNRKIKTDSEANVRIIAEKFIKLDKLNTVKDIFDCIMDIGMFGFKVATTKTNQKVLFVDLCVCLKNNIEFQDNPMINIFQFKVFFGKDRVFTQYINNWFVFKYGKKTETTINTAVNAFADHGQLIMNVFAK